jgi:Domain of unknown function (DUF4145)
MTGTTFKAHCPECDGERVCEVHGSTTTKWSWESKDGQNSAHGGADHSMLQCRGCETVFYLQSSWDSEDVDQWYEPDGSIGGDYARTVTTYPKPTSKTKPQWFSTVQKADQQLAQILDETYLAYDGSLLILAAVGIRTVIDRTTELLGIDPAKPFKEKLDELQTGGWIGDTEKQILEVVIDAGSAAAHRGWSPDAKEAAQLITVLEVFLQKVFLVEKKALGLKASIPPKPARSKAPKAQATPANPNS